ncbi:thiamine pyrophosphate-binding protein [Desulfobacula sp.]|uniref:thiamine pyrophosphate-binding protein n=1 Tax=Desulfobacula sp. TaxID=2593537 RepID=UPI002621821A|nr:thiamine pyrophosphate-binding protein [Desulfobacula sp.]
MATVAQVMAGTLKELGVHYIFGVPSGNWVDYMAAIQAVDGLEFILVSNEGSGGFMADVCWRLTGKVAACFGTMGPGACNQTIGVCGGYLDRSPMIAFSDEVNPKLQHRISQMNIDHQTLFKPITKWTARLKACNVRETLYNALQIATSEVPGPVYIGLPCGIGLDEAADESVTVPDREEISTADTDALAKMASLFMGAKKPVIALGITAMRANVQEMVINILEKFKVPAVLTPMAKGMVPEDHPCYTGVLSHALGNQVGITHQQADLVVGIGFDPVELNYEDWMPHVPLVHIDTVPADLNTKNHTLGCDVVGQLRPSLECLLSLDCTEKEWDMEKLAARKTAMFAQLAAPKGTFGPRRVLEALRIILPKDGIMTCDVGAHSHLIGQQWQTDSPECQLMSNGCSAMGFAIPAAIAAKLCCPEQKVCCVVGDGGLYMMAGEMVTAMRLNVNIVVVVMMDAHLSLIRIKQQRKNYVPYGTSLPTPSPDTDVSPHTLFGVPVFMVKDASQYDHALKEAFIANGPVIIEAFVHAEEYENLVLKGNK